ncbi:hypothetical protein ACRC96_001732 [Campylobacter jejuni]|uniref:hypothetical protein n=1 Tax=Campylobacter coli TaxID=195 RepID=UPI0012C9027F|nr:hypothetical protein [Campylobacter coli]EAI3564116.1 hypothetical protein [Campylobacter jejuni]EAJ2316239.1 hypothetical protein [Campylobacter jejuni]EAK0295642.1 hypothetical protein [Campylobacter jejuni]EAK1096782.1 hypothetical protein [Campylobacter jejuni]EAL1179467.1 hypothetical protein [Campylobacter jejuni]
MVVVWGRIFGDEESFRNLYKSNDNIRFLFGYKNKETEITLRVWVNGKYFEESRNKVKNMQKDPNLCMNYLFKMLEDFEETSFFRKLKKEKIQFNCNDLHFIVSEFFEENEISIIPTYKFNNQTINQKTFFSLLKKYDVKELKYITHILSHDLSKEEYKNACNL